MTGRAFRWDVVATGALAALAVELRHRYRAHHLADLTPLLGAAPAAGFHRRIPLMAGGLAINIVAVTFAGRHIFHLTHQTGSRSCAT